MKVSSLSVRPCVRISRGIVAALGTHVLTGPDTDNTAIASVAVSEIASVLSELWTILPYFGNIIWMILLFPSVFKIYGDLFWNMNSKRHEKELIFLWCLIFSIGGGLFLDNF